MTVDGIQENDSKIQNEEHDHANTAKRVVLVNSIVNVVYDYIGVAYPQVTTEVYSFKTGGSAGTLVATVTVVYTDATKGVLSNVTRS